MASISACATWLDRGPLRPFRSSVKLTGVAVRVTRSVRHCGSVNRSGSPPMDGASMREGESMSALRISGVTVPPVAFPDPPLLNSVGVHEPFALRSIVQLHCDDRVVGLGESYGDGDSVRLLEAAAEAVVGADAFDLSRHARAWL